MANDDQKLQLQSQRARLVGELAQLEAEVTDEGHPIAAPGIDAVRDDRIAAVAQAMAEIDAQIASLEG
jgi:hypothetical protein